MTERIWTEEVTRALAAAGLPWQVGSCWCEKAAWAAEVVHRSTGKTRVITLSLATFSTAALRRAELIRTLQANAPTMSKPLAERFTYTADAERRLVRVKALEPLNGDDLIGIIDRQLAEGSWSFGMLYDLRRTDRITSREDAARVADYVDQLTSKHGTRGPVAMVTSRGDMVGTGQVYAFRTTRSMQMEVFWDLQEAEAWLAERLLPRG